MDWYPHEGPQLEFCERGEFEVLFGGAAGPGKTDCLVMEATRFVSKPGYRAIIFRRTFPQLQEIIDRCWAWYPKIGGTYKATEHRWYFPSGATINLGHMQHETDKYNYQGKEFHFVGFDELTQFLETQYLYLHSRVRTTETGIPLRIRSTTNPGGIGHHWVRNRFVTSNTPKETYIDPKSGQSRCFIPATVYDNPTLVENDPGYIQRLEALPEVEKMRLLYGNWDAFEGQVFGELSQRTHGCDPFPIPPEWEKFQVFDWGYGRPWGSLWFAADYDGDLYLYRAYYGMVKNESGQFDPNRGARQTNIEICREIINQENENISFRVADPACWGPTKQRGSNMVLGPSFVEDASNEGLFFLKADNDRLRGKQQVHMRFRIETETDESGEVIGERPLFHAFTSDENGPKGIKRWWDEIMSLQEDPKNPEDVDTDQADEGYDCLQGEMQVETDKGLFKIKDLVGKRGKVRTVFGLWTPFNHCKKYGRNRDVVKINFTDGTHLICTPDHQILAEDLRWIAAEKMKPGQRLYHQKCRNLMENVITYRGVTSQGTKTYIEQCGSTTMVLYHTCMSFITRMATPLIIILKILNSCIATSTTHITPRIQTIQTGSKRCTKGPRSGTGAKRVKSGTKNIMRTIVSTICTRPISLFVKCVGNLLMPIIQPCFVLMHASPRGVDGLVKTTSIENAKFAGKYLKQTSLSQGKHAHEDAVGPYSQKQKEVLNIEYCWKDDVYCLNAKHTRAFKANGVMVANCTRYGFMSRPIVPKRIEKIPRGSFAQERQRLIRARKYSRRHGVSLAAAYARVR